MVATDHGFSDLLVRNARLHGERAMVFAADLPKKADGQNDRERIRQRYG